MPSIKNSCDTCPLAVIPKKLPAYTVEADNEQKSDVQSAVELYAGFKGARKSRHEIINTAARECVIAVLSGDCQKFTFDGKCFSFKR